MKCIAIIPARCGSKSIPMKNIRPIAGKPLLFWTMIELENCNNVDSVIVATDCNEIADVVKSFGFRKTKIYWRSDESATDTASTEDVLLEVLENPSFHAEDLVLLVQATSPLTREIDFHNSIQLFKNKSYDSLLSCIRTKSFFWSQDGRALNYDPNLRPRRQDFEGMFQENGAFYLSSVSQIKAHKNRISGKIGIFELPEYMALELDEPFEWAIMEQLIYKYKNVGYNILPKIKLFVSDVDGVLTDAGMYYSEKGDELKKFNTRDGKAFQLMREKGIKTAFVTSENTQLVHNRAKKLKIDFLYQGKEHGGKLKAVKDICQKLSIKLEETAYIGDDINCKELLENVGFAACPSDAVNEIKNITRIHILESKGGSGCVREFYEKYLKSKV